MRLRKVFKNLFGSGVMSSLAAQKKLSLSRSPSALRKNMREVLVALTELLHDRTEFVNPLTETVDGLVSAYGLGSVEESDEYAVTLTRTPHWLFMLFVNAPQNSFLYDACVDYLTEAHKDESPHEGSLELVFTRKDRDAVTTTVYESSKYQAHHFWKENGRLDSTPMMALYTKNIGNTGERVILRELGDLDNYI